jgi:hypothetical protein
VGYAAGDAANNLAFSMTSFFLLIYYTDVVGISAAAAGTLFLVIRIWDGLALTDYLDPAPVRPDRPAAGPDAPVVAQAGEVLVRLR